ncbi:hypothetical protein [Brevundimonas subvibrioides]|uniref:Uncharacterized protein n=1 Tax=Brevundimonas subvibrioides (strain ATCC 15264 / DSM 4735 / LMG 14903 / NBRC 16000 / CB 81) TaxID=633149 RepID=D9QFW7_BRESC|nr:hypothetical protein [Brevundimonas subvibrioides]ADL00681.1 hypothetical protein Bresu_1369 [Brevundimonas subvibrioides ATCC 15264]
MREAVKRQRVEALRDEFDLLSGEPPPPGPARIARMLSEAEL